MTVHGAGDDAVTVVASRCRAASFSIAWRGGLETGRLHFRSRVLVHVFGDVFNGLDSRSLCFNGGLHVGGHDGGCSSRNYSGGSRCL